MDLYLVPEDENFPMKSHVTVASVALGQLEESMRIVWMGIGAIGLVCFKRVEKFVIHFNCSPWFSVPIVWPGVMVCCFICMFFHLVSS